MADRHPNALAIEAAVDRWIAEALKHPVGASHLRRRVSWLDDQIGRMAASVDNDTRMPVHLEGLTVSDLHGAQARLLVAAQDLEGAA